MTTPSMVRQKNIGYSSRVTKTIGCVYKQGEFMLLLLLWGCIPVLTSAKDSAETSCWMTANNTWPSSTPRNLQATGFRLGQTPPDMCMLDQHGDMVSMWQFYGQVVVLDVSAEWCAPCQELAKEVDEVWHTYKDRDVIYLTILTEDNSSEVPDQSVLEHWATQFSVSAPVLADSEEYRNDLVPNGAYPRLYILNRQLEIVVDGLNPATDASIRAAIESEL